MAPRPAVANRRRRRKRVFLVVLLCAAALAAAPFLFTSSIARYIVAHSVLRKYPLKFRSASLSPAGALTLYDLSVEDTAESAGKPLLACSRARIEFSWSELRANHVRMLRFQDLDLTLRPGRDTTMTLLRLFSAPSPSPTTILATSSTASAAPPTFSFDQCLITGHVRLEGYEPWLSAAQLRPGQPLDLQIAASAGTPANPSWDISLLAGNAQSMFSPWLTSRLHIAEGQVVITQLNGMLADAEVTATAAYDIESGTFSRGRLYFNNFSAARAMAGLPTALREAFPGTLDGKLSARLFLNGFDAQRISFLAELVCPDRLQFTPRPPASPPTTAAPAHPTAELSNLALSANIAWNFNRDAAPDETTGAGGGAGVARRLSSDRLPEITRGRFTADELVLLPPRTRDADATLPITRIKSDFSLVRGQARLDDFYADLPGNARISAQALYSIPAVSLDRALLSLNGLDAALFNPWLPPDTSLMGQFDAEFQAAATGNGLSLAASVGLDSQSTLKISGGALTLSGTPAPSLSLHVALDPAWRTIQIENAEIAGIGALHADGAMIKLLHDRLPAAQDLLDTIHEGAFASFDKLAFAGRLGLQPPVATGMLTLNGLDLGAPTPDQPPTLQNLTFKGAIRAPLTATGDWSTYHLDGGEFLAEKLALSQNAVTEISGFLAVSDGKFFVTRAALTFAQGKIQGDAALTLPARLDALHFDFSAINQQTLSRSLYPDLFSAEGPISGKLTLERSATGHLAGSLALTADAPGRLKISREVSSGVFAPAAHAAAQSGQERGGPPLPQSFDQIVTDQLADYPYSIGKALLSDVTSESPATSQPGTRPPDRLALTLDYSRAPLKSGEPGYGVPVTIAGQVVPVSYPLNLPGITLSLNTSIPQILERITGITAPRPAATQPSSTIPAKIP